MPGICRYPAKRTTANREIKVAPRIIDYSSLTEKRFSVKDFFIFGRQKTEAKKMEFLPTLEKAKEIAAQNRYKVMPVSCEILADICTPIEAMRILKNVSTHCYMLESAQASLLSM